MISNAKGKMAEMDDYKNGGNIFLNILNGMGGKGWTGLEAFIALTGTILLPVVLLLYAHYSGWNWSLLQNITAYFMAYDIMGGCLIYNSFSFKRARYRVDDVRDYIKHALIHIQPLVVAVFYSETLLPLFTFYWLVLYVIYIVLFEPTPKVSAFKEALIKNSFIIGNFILLTVSYVYLQERELFLYGAVNFLALAPLTLLQCKTPLRTQRLLGTFIVVFMSLLNVTILKVPMGFAWFMPILYVKLFMGYNAREYIVS